MDSARAGNVGPLKDAAARWVLRQHGGEWSAADAAELQEWMQAATTHRIAYLRAQAMWNEASRLKVLGAGLKAGVVPGPAEFNDSPFFRQQPVSGDLVAPAAPRRAARWRWVAAASVLLAAGSYVAWHRAGAPAEEYSTTVGVTSVIPLPDGSKVTLNTDSEIQVAVTRTQRAVALQQGEAFFEVTDDPHRPFVVSAGSRRIEVLGTKFSVRRVNEEVRVVVTDGRVRIDDVQVAAGGVAHVEERQVAVQQRPLPEVEELLSWRSGFVVFHETPLAEAAAELNRYNRKQIVIRDAGVAGLKVSGNFKATYLDSFVGLLEDGFPVTVERRGERFVLTARDRE